MLFSHNKLSSRGGSVKHEIPGTHIYCSCPDRHAGQLDSSAINTELKDRVKKSEASHAKRRDTSNALSTL